MISPSFPANLLNTDSESPYFYFMWKDNRW